jgi:hypothetical protein
VDFTKITAVRTSPKTQAGIVKFWGTKKHFATAILELVASAANPYIIKANMREWPK